MTLYNFLGIFLLAVLPILGSAQMDIDIRDQVIIPRTYVVTKTPTPIKIDGKEEAAWENALFSSPFVDIESTDHDIKQVEFNTQVKMLWDDSYLYILAVMEEPHVWADIKERDQIIFYNNDFEVFIDPSPHTETYGEIEINALNTVWDLLLNEPYRVGGYANFHWNLDDLKTAVRVHGSLNKSKDMDEGWTVEMAIPMKPFIEMKNDHRTPIQEGDQWRINFSRVEWDFEIVDGKYQKKKKDGELVDEHNWVWSPLGAINMHMPENWGIVYFTEGQYREGPAIKEDRDLVFKQGMYALFREAHWGSLKGKWPHDSETINAVYASDKTLYATWQKTNAGFEITAENSETGNWFTINEKGVLKAIDPPKTSEFQFATWVHGGQEMDSAVWLPKLAHYDSLGISEILVGGSPDLIKDLIPLASRYDIKVHVWMWTLNRPNDSIAMQHPEWYAVNRNGENSLNYRAYVDYYQWLSPFHPEAREYIKSNVRKLLQVEGLASIHLDYVRYVDVILGTDLQPKYGLIQDHEMPEYDYGYHPIAREQFKELFGKDPMEMEHPELSTEWRQFRLNAITTLVNEIAEEVHAENQKISAAVFPFPEMSRQMVRQAWDDWNLDYVFPMIYHNFYRENIEWIGFATEQGLRDVDYPLFTGLYLPGFESAEDFQHAIEVAKEKGASGVCFFTLDGMKPELKEVLIQENQVKNAKN